MTDDEFPTTARSLDLYEPPSEMEFFTRSLLARQAGRREGNPQRCAHLPVVRLHPAGHGPAQIEWRTSGGHERGLWLQL
jgi:hypothetical protein